MQVSYTPRRGRRLLCSVWFFTATVCAADDPYATESLTASRPGVRWSGTAALPEIPSGGAAAVPATPLSLAALTELALQNQPATRAAWAAARAEAAAYGGARSAYLPTLDGLISAVVSSGSDPADDTESRLATSLTLGYVLYDFGGRAARVDAARFRLLAANLSQNRVLQDVVLRVEQAYYQYSGDQQLAEATRQTVANAEAAVAAANARRQTGIATVGDVYQAETALAEARLQMQRALGQVAVSRGALANAVGLRVTRSLTLEPPPEQPPVDTVRLAVDTYLDRARRERPDLAAAEAEARAARARVDAAAAGGRPTIEFGASAGYAAGPDSGAASAAINLRVPLFNGYRTRYAVREAQAQADALAATRDRIGQQVELDVWTAYYELDTASAAIGSAQAFLKSATQAHQVAEARYRAGVGTLLDLLSAQAAEANARVALIQSQLAWYSALSRLNHAVGAFWTDSTSAP